MNESREVSNLTARVSQLEAEVQDLKKELVAERKKLLAFHKLVERFACSMNAQWLAGAIRALNLGDDDEPV